MPPLSKEEEINLANLPSDVIRKVVKVGIESLNGMKTISHRWQFFAAEHLNAPNNRKYLPEIKCFRMHFDEFGEKSLSMRINERYRGYFGFPWHISEEIVEVSLGRLKNFMCEGIKLEALICLLGRCSHIDRFELPRFEMELAEEELNVLKIAFGSIEIEELAYARYQPLKEESIDWSGSGATALKNARHFSVRRLVFLNCRHLLHEIPTNDACSDFITLATKHVAEVEFTTMVNTNDFNAMQLHWEAQKRKIGIVCEVSSRLRIQLQHGTKYCVAITVFSGDFTEDWNQYVRVAAMNQ